MRHPELDGIRGLAILAVLIHHSLRFEPWTLPDALLVEFANLTWAGVDIFFALSGFLITGILFDSRKREGYFGNFYMRRTLRIFPLYYFYLAVLALSAFVLTPSLAGAAEWRHDQIWAWLYATNWLNAQQGSFGHFNTQHLWSLAIEEQFYLLWPLVVWKLERRRLMQVCVALIAASFLARVAMVAQGVHPVSVYVMTFTRLDGLLAGAFVALLIRGPTPLEQLKRYAIVSSVLGSVLLLGAIGAHTKAIMHTPAMQTIGFTAVALLASSLILWARTVGTPILRIRPLTTLGRYSYGLYVWHHMVFAAVFALWPIKTMAGGGFMFPEYLARAAVCWSASFAAALVSWHLLERHFMEWKERYSHEPANPPLAPGKIPVAERSES